MLIASAPGARDRVFSEKMACPDCGISFPELTPQSFSSNSPQGMCVDCNGLGRRVEIDPQLVIPDESRSLGEGAIAPWSGPTAPRYYRALAESLAEHYGVEGGQVGRLDPMLPGQRAQEAVAGGDEIAARAAVVGLGFSF